MIVIFGQVSAYSAFNLSQFALGQDCLCRTFRLAYAAVDALVGMDDQHVVALVETIDGAHFDAIHIFALDAIVSDHIGHDDVPVAAGFSRKNSANLTPANASASRRLSKLCLPSSERMCKSASLNPVALRSGIQAALSSRVKATLIVSTCYKESSCFGDCAQSTGRSKALRLFRLANSDRSAFGCSPRPEQSTTMLAVIVSLIHTLQRTYMATDNRETAQ